MRFTAYNADDEVIATRDYYSVGGGVVNQDDATDDRIVPDETRCPTRSRAATSCWHRPHAAA